MKIDFTGFKENGGGIGGAGLELAVALLNDTHEGVDVNGLKFGEFNLCPAVTFTDATDLELTRNNADLSEGEQTIDLIGDLTKAIKKLGMQTLALFLRGDEGDLL